jgi:glycosyltransferase involved in cell wall biosynthesis
MCAAPRVSVVMPAYQVAATIEASIRSVLAQTMPDFELIIVDDGSTDATLAIARRFTDSRIRVITQANRGLAGARNTGIAAARGAYIALLDSDDLFLPDKLAVHYTHLESDPTIGVSYAGAILIDEAGRELGIRQCPKLGRVSAADVFFGRAISNGSTPVFRADMLRAAALGPDEEGRLHYFDETLRRAEDVECWTRLALRSDLRFAPLPGAQTRYRISAGSLSADVARQLDAWAQMCARIERYAPAFIAAHRAAAYARALRYLARRCVYARERRLALAMIGRALSAHPLLLLREPGRTLSVLLACLALRLLPPPGFARLARLAGVRVMGV